MEQMTALTEHLTIEVFPRFDHTSSHSGLLDFMGEPTILGPLVDNATSSELNKLTHPVHHQSIRLSSALQRWGSP